MKRSLFFAAIALIGLTFSCEKDSLMGFSNEEANLRTETEYDGLTVPVMRKIEADYKLVEVDALPEDGGLIGLRPPAGYIAMMYSMKGNASLLGELAPGMSYEIHYLPPEADPGKEVLEVPVWGRFMSSDDLSSLRYVGECIYYPNGKRVSRYEFYHGTGRFEGAYGWIDGIGSSWEDGRVMKFTANGKVSIPSLVNEAASAQ